MKKAKISVLLAGCLVLSSAASALASTTTPVVKATNSSSIPMATASVVTVGATPTSLAITSIMANQMTVSWVGSSDTYYVYLNGAVVNISNNGQTAVMLSQLTPGAAYSVIIQGYTNGVATGMSTPLNVVMPNCAVPSNLAISSIASTSATLQWSSVVGSTGYTVYVNGIASYAISGTSCYLTGLSPNTNYALTVANSGPQSNNPPSNALIVTTLGSLPSAPTGLVASYITPNSFNVAWSPVSGATSYTVYVNGTLKGTTSSAAYSVTGLNANSVYSISVGAVNASGSSSQSNAISVATSAFTPSTPTGLALSYFTSNSCSVAWSPVVGATNYEVYVNGLLTGVTSSASYYITGLNANTPYNISVAASNTSGASLQSTAIGVRTLAIAPVGLVASSITPNSCNIAWSPVAGATSYAVYINGTFKASVTGTSYFMSNLNPNTSYTISVVDLNAYGASPQSNTISIATPAILPSAPTGLTASFITPTSCNLTWSPVAGATSYVVYVNGIFRSTAYGTSYYVFGLNPGMYNTATVVDLSPSGYSPMSNPVSI